MDGASRTSREWLKRIIAGGIFLTLLFGGASIVLFVVASALNSMGRNFPETVPAYPGWSTATTTTPASPVDTPSSTVPNPYAQQGSSASSTGTTLLPTQTPVYQNPSQTEPGWSDSFSYMHSPLGDALDSGGVVIGEHVQRTFGSLLGGLMKALFLEEDDQTGVQSP